MIDLRDLPKIDTHFHFFDYSLHDLPIAEGEKAESALFGDFSPLLVDYGVEDYLADLAGHSVVKMVHEEADWDPNDPSAAGRGVPFAPLQAISTGIPAAWSVRTADVDGDGDLDVLSAGAGDHTIEWHENTAGDGSAWSTHTFPVVEDPQQVFAADVDGDGDIRARQAQPRSGARTRFRPRTRHRTGPGR